MHGVSRGKSVIVKRAYLSTSQVQLVLPIFRKVWPQLVAREALTVLPMDTPEIVRMFMIAVAKKADGSEVQLPSLTQDVSGPQNIGVLTPFSIDVPNNFDVLASVGETPATAHLQKDFVVNGATIVTTSGSTTSWEGEVEPDDDGNFSFTVDCGGGISDTVTGNVDFFNGIIHVSSTRATQAEHKVQSITIVGSVSGAEEMRANKIEFRHSKVRLNAIDHEIQAEWSVQYEQDVKAYFDMNVQAQLVDTFGQNVALDIDRRLINKLIQETTRFHPSAIRDFDKTPAANFAYGPKEWYNQIAVTLNEVSNQIYYDTNIGTANMLLVNPLDVSILKSTADYKFDGNVSGGEFGASPVAGTFADSWKVLVSPVVPSGKMVPVLKPDNPDMAVFIFAPYRPLTISPYPLGNKPSITFLSRYAAKFIRKEGAGLINIISS